MGLSARWAGAGLALALCLLLLPTAQSSDRGAAEEDFPALSPVSRHQAVTVLSGGGDGLRSLTPLILSNLRNPQAAPAVRRALGFLRQGAPLQRERRWSRDGTTFRYTNWRGSFDRIDKLDENQNGLPDLIEIAADSFAESRALLVGQLGLTEPGPLDVVMANVGGRLGGYLVPSEGAGRTRIVLEASEGTTLEELRRATIKQYAFAVALASGTGLEPAWAEAFATWTVMRLTGGPHGEMIDLLSERLRRFSEGLLTEDLDLAAGNAIWFAFLDARYGGSAVRLTIEELADGGAQQTALDRALQRGAGESLSAALREFQLWALLVGDRSDGRHFPFAERLDPPVFVREAEWLPALSVQAEPPVAPLGGLVIRLRPEATDGGLRIHFEGGFTTTWEADVLLVRNEGPPQRVAVDVSPEARGSVTLPLQGLAEAILLIRNLGGDDDGRRFTWAADLERGFPFELGTLEALGRGIGSQGALISWETTSEQNLLGFNILRFRVDGSAPVIVNPVWIPAVGGHSETTSYQFLDSTAETGVSYGYRIQGITLDGLTNLSERVTSSPPLPLR